MVVYPCHNRNRSCSKNAISVKMVINKLLILWGHNLYFGEYDQEKVNTVIHTGLREPLYFHYHQEAQFTIQLILQFLAKPPIFKRINRDTNYYSKFINISAWNNKLYQALIRILRTKIYCYMILSVSSFSCEIRKLTGFGFFFLQDFFLAH